MRQKKSNSSALLFYILGFIFIVGFFYIATHEIPLKTEHVETTLPNDFLNK